MRHGESAPARHNQRFTLTDGHGDPELAPDGRWQAEQLGIRLSRERIDAGSVGLAGAIYDVATGEVTFLAP